MSPFARNIALTAAAALLPALVGLAVAPERARALPNRIDARGSHAMDRVHDTSPTARLLADIAALVVIPAALTAIFARGRLRVSRERDADHVYRHEDDVDRSGDDVGDLEEALETQRSDAVSTVSRAARRND